MDERSKFRVHLGSAIHAPLLCTASSSDSVRGLDALAALQSSVVVGLTGEFSLIGRSLALLGLVIFGGVRSLT